jgi:uncharacterized protein YdhG (YjbR/CyaY superfamily)
MAKKKAAGERVRKKGTRNPATNNVARSTVDKGFTAAERAAMKARAQELKAEARANKDQAEGEKAVLAALAEMPGSDRLLGERLHAIIQATAPSLAPKTWYGMPAYAKGGKVVCFFQSASKFKTRYATFGFMHEANLDDGPMWPTGFALKEITTAVETRIVALVKKAVN